MDKIIEIKNLCKVYKKGNTVALNNINLSVTKGDFVGLLGPNGAGKTTLISILAGLLKPTSGEFSICNLNFKNRQSGYELKNSIGIVPQEYALYFKLTVYENLMFFGSMYGLKGKKLKNKVLSGIKTLGLEQHKSKQVENLSGGLKRRVNLLAGILHNPKILILDEPTVGVDVHSKKIILNLLKEHHQNGTTILYSSHLFNEVQNICKSVVIIDQGEVIVKGKTEDVLKDHQQNSLEKVFLETTIHE